MSHIELIDFVAMMHCSARLVLPFTGSLAVPAQPCHFSVSHRTCRELYRLRASSARLEATTARERVLCLLDAGHDNYNQGNLKAETEALLASTSGSQQPGPDTLRLGQGCWQVVLAPHIRSMSSILGTRFDISYTLHGQHISSNVRYSSKIFGEGWLSAAGTLGVKDDFTVTVVFDRFWIDGKNGLQKNLQGDSSHNLLDRLIGLTGRLLFFEQLSVFPVLYLDEELSCFCFPPLQSNILVRKAPVQLAQGA